MTVVYIAGFLCWLALPAMALYARRGSAEHGPWMERMLWCLTVGTATTAVLVATSDTWIVGASILAMQAAVAACIVGEVRHAARRLDTARRERR